MDRATAGLASATVEVLAERGYRYDASEHTADEIARAEQVIEAATGHRPRGFRGPGYSLSRATLEVLSERGYLYDASTLPTFLGPVARAYYFQTSRHLTAEEKQQRRLLFGGFGDGLQPLKPYLWQVGENQLLEIPVTTLPGLKVPFHFSYLLYIASFSPVLSSLYFRFALRLCRSANIQPSLLLHPLDFLGADDVPELAFFPAMKIPSIPEAGDHRRNSQDPGPSTFGHQDPRTLSGHRLTGNDRVTLAHQPLRTSLGGSQSQGWRLTRPRWEFGGQGHSWPVSGANGSRDQGGGLRDMPMRAVSSMRRVATGSNTRRETMKHQTEHLGAVDHRGIRADRWDGRSRRRAQGRYDDPRHVHSRTGSVGFGGCPSDWVGRTSTPTSGADSQMDIWFV